MRKRILGLCSLMLVAILMCGAVLVQYARATSPKLLVLMYHHLTTDSSKVGPYTILVDNFEQDLIYLRDNGYETITVAEFIAHLDDDVPLPDKPVMLTFDDGNESVYAYAYPLLKKYNMTASAAIVGEYADAYTEANDHNLAYSYMTWSEVKELQDSGVFEIQNHTYHLHQMDKKREGCKINSGEAIAAYTEMLASDVGDMQEAIYKHTGWWPNAFAYPYGMYCEESFSVLQKLGFRIAFTCESHWNLIPDEKSEFVLLGRFNRSGMFSTAEFFQRI